MRYAVFLCFVFCVLLYMTMALWCVLNYNLCKTISLRVYADIGPLLSRLGVLPIGLVLLLALPVAVHERWVEPGKNISQARLGPVAGFIPLKSCLSFVALSYQPQAKPKYGDQNRYLANDSDAGYSSHYA